jgi:hypothetical protein
MSEWQPIETAPTGKGVRILGFGTDMGFNDEPAIGVVEWNHFRGHWVLAGSEATEYSPEPCVVTHWMPLPEPPQ